VGRMLNVCAQRGFVFELHDAAEGVALSSRRDVWADVGLEESGNYALEGEDVFSGSFDLSVGCAGLPLKGEDVEDGGGMGLGVRCFGRVESEQGGSDGGGTELEDGAAG